MKNTYSEDPLVSVIIPSYNRAWVLEEAINSALSQDYPNTELIVINDGSTDSTAELLASYGDRIRVLTQENKGVSAARNAGIKKSKGEFIALLDSDDTWMQGKLTCQLEFFKKHLEAMICQTEEIWIRKGKRVNPQKKHKKPSGMIFEPSLHLCLVSPSAVMMRRKLFELKGWFNEDFTICEDYDMWLRISSTLPIYLIDKAYITKRGGHDDQLSSLHSRDKFRIQSLKALIESPDLSPEQKSAAKSVLKKKCRIYANGCMKRGKTEEAQYYFQLSGSS